MNHLPTHKSTTSTCRTTSCANARTMCLRSVVMAGKASRSVHRKFGNRSANQPESHALSNVPQTLQGSSRDQATPQAHWQGLSDVIKFQCFDGIAPAAAIRGRATILFPWQNKTTTSRFSQPPTGEKLKLESVHFSPPFTHAPPRHSVAELSRSAEKLFDLLWKEKKYSATPS